MLTPVKVFSARLPLGFALFTSKISKLDKKLLLPAETALLIREHVARINVCLFCMDIGRWAAVQGSMSERKIRRAGAILNEPALYRRRTCRARLRNGATRDKKVNPDTFARLTGYYSERQICEIVWLVASEHVYNITNIGLNIHSDMLCAIRQ